MKDGTYRLRVPRASTYALGNGSFVALRIKALDIKHPCVQADATKDHSGFLHQAHIHDCEAAALPSLCP